MSPLEHRGVHKLRRITEHPKWSVLDIIAKLTTPKVSRIDLALRFLDATGCLTPMKLVDLDELTQKALDDDPVLKLSTSGIESVSATSCRDCMSLREVYSDTKHQDVMATHTAIALMYVARAVSKSEIMNSPEANAAVLKEWRRLEEYPCLGHQKRQITRGSYRGGETERRRNTHWFIA